MCASIDWARVCAIVVAGPKNTKPRASDTGGVRVYSNENKWCEEGDSNPYTLAGVRT